MAAGSDHPHRMALRTADDHIASTVIAGNSCQRGGQSIA